MCRRRKPLASFHLCSASPDAHQYTCKRCRRAYDAERRMRQPGFIARALRGWKAMTANRISTLPRGAQTG
jgi:hypothetical protein